MALSTVRVETNGSALARSWRVFLDGKDISASLIGIEIYGGIDRVATVNLVCRAIVDLPQEITALVNAQGVEVNGNPG